MKAVGSLIRKMVPRFNFSSLPNNINKELVSVFAALKPLARESGVLNELAFWSKIEADGESQNENLGITEIDSILREELSKIHANNDSINIENILLISEIGVILRSSNFKSSQFIPLIRTLESENILSNFENNIKNSDKNLDYLLRIWVSFYRIRLNKETCSFILNCIMKQQMELENVYNYISCPFLMLLIRKIDHREFKKLMEFLESKVPEMLAKPMDELNLMETQTKLLLLVLKSKVNLPIKHEEFINMLHLIKNKKDEIPNIILQKILGVLSHFSLLNPKEERELLKEAYSVIRDKIWEEYNESFRTFYLASMDLIIEGKPRDIDSLLEYLKNNLDKASKINIFKYVMCYLKNNKSSQYRELNNETCGELDVLYENYFENPEEEDESTSSMMSSSFNMKIEPMLHNLGLSYDQNHKFEIFNYNFIFSNTSEWIRQNSELFGEETEYTAEFFEGEYPVKLGIEELYISRLSCNSDFKHGNLFYQMTQNLRKRSKVICIPLRSRLLHFFSKSESGEEKFMEFFAREIKFRVKKEKQRIEHRKNMIREFKKESSDSNI